MIRYEDCIQNRNNELIGYFIFFFMQMLKKKMKLKLDKKKCSEENVVNGEMKNVLVMCLEVENKENV